LDSILDLVVGHEMYSFMDGYNGNNQVKMMEEDKENTTVILEWCLYAYMMLCHLDYVMLLPHSKK
jgi:hypothetical protein